MNPVPDCIYSGFVCKFMLGKLSYELLDSFIQENVIGEDYTESKEESYLKDEVRVIRVKEEYFSKR